MNLTKLSFRKIKWLFNTNKFKNNPIKVLSRVFAWELFRIFGTRMDFTFDGNLKIFLYPNDGVARLTYYFDYHEPEIFTFLDNFLNHTKEKLKEVIYCDIGANIGLYTLFVAKRIGNKGKVISFEPQPLTYQRLIENIKLNNLENILSVNKAVGDINSSIAIRQSPDSAKAFVSRTKEDRKDIKVEMVSFDNFLKNNDIAKVDYLKIDVEGFEYFVLQGMKEFLKNSPPIIIQIELYEEFLKRSGSSINQTLNYLNDLGYTFWQLNSNNIKLIECKDNISGDLFLIKKENIKELSNYLY
jgi:FkbM family methyltransferase